MLARPIIGRRLLGLAKPATYMALRSLLFKPDFSKLRLREQPPGHIVGTVNDAYEIPLVSPYESNYHWTYERMLAMGLVPMAAFPFFMGVEFPYVDTAFCLSILFHAHCGIKSCIIDYIPERVYGFWHKAACNLLTFGSFVSMYGIYVLETAENGLFDFISRL